MKARVRVKHTGTMFILGCQISQQYASVSQGQIFLDNITFRYTEIEVGGQTYLSDMLVSLRDIPFFDITFSGILRYNVHRGRTHF